MLMSLQYGYEIIIVFPRGVIHTIGHVDEVIYDDDGVKELLIKDQEDRVTADLFIDCTGFKSLLNKTRLEII